MSPLATSLRTIFWTAVLWRSLVVRMKSSLRDVQLFPEVLEDGHDAVGQLVGVDALLGGRLDHLDAVLVGAGEEERVVAGQAVIAGDGVGADGGVNVAEVRLGVGVVDGGGDVEGHGISCQLLLSVVSCQLLVASCQLSVVIGRLSNRRGRGRR